MASRAKKLARAAADELGLTTPKAVKRPPAAKKKPAPRRPKRAA